ncbi:MAG: hypothetical protein ACWGSQ_09570 [Longimicrobiales bacterium]
MPADRHLTRPEGFQTSPIAMRVIPFLLAFLLGLVPGAAGGQTLLELLWGIEEGGGWVRIPVQRGEGSLQTAVLPSRGLSLRGCAQVWGGHSGSWDIQARDLLGTAALDVSLLPGEPRDFTYQAGPRSRLQVDVRWSEPRDTTLLLWVGLETPRFPRDPCQPVYGGG